MAAKSFGWVLLLLGLIIILGTLYHSYNIFTGKIQVPKIFSQQTETKQPETTQEPSSDIEEIAQQILKEQIEGILPVFPDGEFIQLLNLFCWSIFAGIAIFAGSQISSLGIKLMKK